MKKIVGSLSSASSVLLGLSATASADAEPWIIDLGVMNYIEQDRNTGVEVIANGSRDLVNGGTLSLGAELDVITGATPNGATSSNVPQTFTMSSGVGSYRVDANELPADDTHMDTRLGVRAGLRDPLGQSLNADYHALVSMEFDYLAFAGGGTLTWDLNQRNTTLSAGINLEYNRVHPVGNTPIPLATMQAPGQQQPRGVASVRKSGQELSIGVTQVIDQSSLVQMRLTHSQFSGYLTDPYKLLSVVDDINPASLGSTQRYVFESRPDSRDMNSVYLAYKRHYDAGILDVSYRLYDDSWEVRSHTLDLAFQIKLDDRRFLRPGIRLYQQDAAWFYRHSLRSSQPLPAFASADSRLAAFDATTVSLEYGRQLAFDRKHSVAIEFYTQQGDSSPSDAVGLQRQQDLYPTLKTLVFKYVYSLNW